MLGEAAIARLDQQDNKSQYIDDLITGAARAGSEQEEPEKPTAAPTGGLTEARVMYLITQETEKIKEELKNNRGTTASQSDRDIQSSTKDPANIPGVFYGDQL
jgi:hypothetical protein